MTESQRRSLWNDTQPCTPLEAYLDRRRFLRNAGLALGAASLPSLAGCSSSAVVAEQPDGLMETLHPHSGNPFTKGVRNAKYAVDRPMTEETIAGRFNNFYEFTTSKARVWQLARSLKVRPWTVEVSGEIAKPLTLGYDDIVRKMPFEERVYRFRCVEAWAMTVPWTGFAFKAFLDLVRPTSAAKYVRFLTFFRPEQAVGQQPPTSWTWPYYEALTIEEAANELTFMATGIFGHELPNQHGAPLRLVVPWKYGYKGAKSIVKIIFTKKRPPTFWNDAAANEYSFCSNVDPNKPHPRWSQATERFIGTQQHVATQPYNGYGAFVHNLYKGTKDAAL